MMLAHGFSISTMDIDALVFRSEMSQAELDPLVKEVATELGLPGDWLNSYFNTFLFALPADYADRLLVIYQGTLLTALALSVEDLLVLKCMARREKDVPHARALLKKSRALSVVEKQLNYLAGKRIPGAEEALDFFDELQDESS